MENTGLPFTSRFNSQITTELKGETITKSDLGLQDYNSNIKIDVCTTNDGRCSKESKPFIEDSIQGNSITTQANILMQSYDHSTTFYRFIKGCFTDKWGSSECNFAYSPDAKILLEVSQK